MYFAKRIVIFFDIIIVLLINQKQGNNHGRTFNKGNI